MKRTGKRSALLLLTVGLVALCIVLFMPRHYEPVALIGSMKFGMSPAEIRSILGTPDSVKNSDLSPTVACSWSGEYEEKPAEIRCCFVRVLLHFELYEVTINCQTDSESEKTGISEKMLEQLRSEYSGLNGFYEETSDDGYLVGVQKGAVGVDCRIIEKADGIHACLARIW